MYYPDNEPIKVIFTDGTIGYINDRGQTVTTVAEDLSTLNNKEFRSIAIVIIISALAVILL